MKFTAAEIAGYLQGEIIGDPEAEVSSFARIEEGKAGSISFLSNPKYENFLYDSESSVILVNRDFAPRHAVKATLIRVNDAYQALGLLLEYHERSLKENRTGIESPCFIDKTAVLGDSVYFGAFSYAGQGVAIGDRVKVYPQVYLGDGVVIGADTVIYAGVKIYRGTKIGERCTIHAGAVVGSDGFGFAPLEDGSYRKIPQVGRVIVEDDVEIGANTTIDCGTLDSTIIRRGVKLDNLIQVGHNCEIGEHTVIAAQSGLAGSTKVGRYCRLAGQTGLAGHLEVGDNVQIGAQSGVTKNIKSNCTVFGSPAADMKNAIRSYIVQRNLPQLRQEIIDLQKELRDLKLTLLKKSE